MLFGDTCHAAEPNRAAIVYLFIKIKYFYKNRKEI